MSLKGLEPAISCVRDQDASTTQARHMWETESLNGPQIYACVIYQIPWIREITEFNESYAPFKKTPISCIDGDSLCNRFKMTPQGCELIDKSILSTKIFCRCLSHEKQYSPHFWLQNDNMFKNLAYTRQTPYFV